jgi:hypothetical protein
MNLNTLSLLLVGKGPKLAVLLSLEKGFLAEAKKW